MIDGLFHHKFQKVLGIKKESSSLINSWFAFEQKHSQVDRYSRGRRGKSHNEYEPCISTRVYSSVHTFLLAFNF